MPSAIVSLLAPAVTAEGKGDAGSQAALFSAPVTVQVNGAVTNVAVEGKADSFNALLSGLQAQGRVPVMQTESARVSQPFMLASLTGARVAGGAVSDDALVAPALPEVPEEARALPAIDPSAFSLISAPIAYTTDAQTAAVAVFDANPTTAKTPAEASLAAFPDMPAEKGVTEKDQKSTSIFVPIAEVAGYDAQPPAVGAASQEVDVNLPEMPVAALPAPVEPHAAMEPDAPVSEDGADNESTEATVALPQLMSFQPVPVTLTPLRADVEGGEQDAADGLHDISLPSSGKATIAPQTTPAASSDGAAGDGAHEDDAQTDMKGQEDPRFRPVGEDASVETQGKDVVKPRAEVQDFRNLLHDTSLTASSQGHAQTGAAQPSGQGAEAHGLKLALAQEATPIKDQIHVQVRQAVEEGMDRITLRLDPPELGKLHIKLDITHDGHANVRITADKAETLDLMQRDMRGLERALQEAGIKTDSGSLQFDLRGQSQQQAGAEFGFGQEQGGGGQEASDTASAAKGSTGVSVTESDDPMVSAVLADGSYRLVASEGVDIKV